MISRNSQTHLSGTLKQAYIKTFDGVFRNLFLGFSMTVLLFFLLSAYMLQNCLSLVRSIPRIFARNLPVLDTDAKTILHKYDFIFHATDMSITAVSGVQVWPSLAR